MTFAFNMESKIHYHTEGKGPPMVLSHGFMMDLTCWYEFGYVDELKSKFTLLIIDARGHGESDKPHIVSEYTGSKMAKDVLSVMDHAGVETAHFLGFSLGGRTGLELAVIMPHRLRSLIIASSTPGTRTEAGKKSDRRRIKMFREGPQSVARLMDKLSPEMDLYRKKAIEGDLQAYLARTQAGMRRPDITSKLENLGVPCLMYAGSSDPLSHQSSMEACKRIPSATFMSLPDLKHMYTFGRTDLVFPLINEFLGNIPLGEPLQDKGKT